MLRLLGQLDLGHTDAHLHALLVLHEVLDLNEETAWEARLAPASITPAPKSSAVTMRVLLPTDHMPGKEKAEPIRPGPRVSAESA